ncbi:hypothetical protein Lal_00039875, partial [Lupinus albus]
HYYTLPIHCGLAICQHKFSLSCIRVFTESRQGISLIIGRFDPLKQRGEFSISSSNDKPNPNYRSTIQSNPKEQNVELNRISLYSGLLLIFVHAVLFSNYFFN